MTISIVGTNDLHGRISRLPMLGGFVNNLRRERVRQGGGVLLIDAGDMFQGTLESNRAEGVPVVRAYNALAYTAAAVGNHEFDYGPVGPRSSGALPGDDLRGALKARAAEAAFPLLTANVLEADTRDRVNWPNMPPTFMAQVAGVTVGIIGVSTAETLETTLSSNVLDLAMAPLADTIAAHAERLRSEGASVVVVTAHAGGECDVHDNPDDLSSCEPDEEIFEVARALPTGLVDVIVAGHTHQAVSHRVNGIAIIESLAYGVAFGRVDLTVDLADSRVSALRIYPPKSVCLDMGQPIETCELGDYAGAPVERDADIRTAIEDDLERARALREEPLGVRLSADFLHSRSEEGPLGNLVADLMREARPEVDVALMNGGGIRDSVPAGELTYGQLYEILPFDNRFAFVTLTGAELKAVLVRNARHDGGILSLSGVRARVVCHNGEPRVDLRRANGRRIRDAERLTVLTNDYLATTSEPVFVRAREEGRLRMEAEPPIREAVAAGLRHRGGTLSPEGPLFDPRHPRFAFPQRPLAGCE